MNPRARIITVTVGLAVAFTAVSARLIYIQIVKQEEYREEAIRLHTSGEPVPAQRGSILDASGRVLARASRESKYGSMEKSSPNARRNCPFSPAC